MVNTLPESFYPCENLFKLHLISLGSTIVTFLVLVLLTISYIIHLRAICWYVITIFLIFEHELQMALPTKFRHTRRFELDILLKLTISSGV